MKNLKKSDHTAASEWADQVMGSIDGLERATSNPFLFTRIMSQLNQPESNWEKAANWISKPAFAFGAVALFLSINVWVFIKDKEAAHANMALKAKQTEQLLAAEFSGASSYSLVESNDDK
jgi:hypothetical protein